MVWKKKNPSIHQFKNEMRLYFWNTDKAGKKESYLAWVLYTCFLYTYSLLC